MRTNPPNNNHMRYTKTYHFDHSHAGSTKGYRGVPHPVWKRAWKLQMEWAWWWPLQTSRTAEKNTGHQLNKENSDMSKPKKSEWAFIIIIELPTDSKQCSSLLLQGYLEHSKTFAEPRLQDSFLWVTWKRLDKATWLEARLWPFIIHLVKLKMFKMFISPL